MTREEIVLGPLPKGITLAKEGMQRGCGTCSGTPIT